MRLSLQPLVLGLSLTLGASTPFANASQPAASADYLLGWYSLRDGAAPEFTDTPRAQLPSGALVTVPVGAPIHASDLVGAIRKVVKPAVIPDYLSLGDNRQIRDAIARATKANQTKVGVNELNMAFVLRMVSNLLVEEASFQSANGRPELSPAVPVERVEYALSHILVQENRRLNPGCAPEEFADEAVLFDRLKEKIGFRPYAFTIRWDAKQFRDAWPELVISGQRWPAGVNPVLIENGLVDLKDRFPTTLDELRTLIQKKLSEQAVSLAKRRLVESWVAELLARDPQAGEVSAEVIEKAYFRDFSKSMEKFASVTADATLTEIRVGIPEAASDSELDPASCGLMHSAYFRCERIFDDSFSGEVAARLRELESRSRALETAMSELIGAEQRKTDRLLARERKEHKQDALREALLKRMDELREKTRKDQAALRLAARTEVPPKAFSVAMAALGDAKTASGAPLCAGFPAELKTVRISFDSTKTLASPAERRRAQLVSIVLQDPRIGAAHPLPGLGLMMVEESGAVYRFVVQNISEARGSILPPQDEGVARRYRDDIRLARAAAPALAAMIDARYELHSDTAPFDFAGVSGLRIKAAATAHKTWIPQLFWNDNPSLFKAALE